MNKRSRVTSAKVIAAGDTPLDIMLASMRQLFKEEKFAEAAMIAQRAAPYVHQKFTATQEPAKRHAEQVVQSDLFGPQATQPAAENNAPDEFDKFLH
ncbi:hypothetical protein QM467_04695 [Rhodoblastus sp. 17X3]|uniref:hypothetical protein n=1 Tax=Rhodoblastus sp. 17X3 TaxID=3047026 RepID=UPI0024B828E8|nr:hypothetical protein [Rhodoblastus sp. 17X3]MDI9847358.1 hypothetical protein [Rhodoblastus sp. 17X3]